MILEKVGRAKGPLLLTLGRGPEYIQRSNQKFRALKGGPLKPKV